MPIHPRLFPTLLVLNALLQSLPLPATADPEYLFNSDCGSLDEWEFLDLKGGGKAVIEEDSTVLDGHGSQVISLRGEETLLLAKGIRLTEGTILALWKDPDPKELDADGIVVFEADYPDDLTVVRNTRDRRAHFVVEQDSDRGFQIKYQKAGTDAEPVEEKIHVGLTHDDSWNRSGWMYQKVQIGDGKLRAKFWSAAFPEPEGWPIEIDHPSPKEGRVGIKVWSGKARLARFVVSKQDIPVSPPLMDLAITKNILVVGQDGEVENPPDFRLFLNWGHIPKDNLDFSCALVPDGASRTYEFFIDEFDKQEISLAESSPSFAQALKDLPKKPGRVEVLIHLLQRDPGKETPTELGTVSRSFEYRTADQYRNRFSELRERAEKIYSAESNKLSDTALEATAALSLLNYARINLKGAEFESVDRTLGYVEECLLPPLRLTGYRFGEVSLPALNLVMGATYSIEVPWQSLGVRKSETLTARLEITDDLRIETPIRVDAKIAPGSWADGQTVTVFDFQVPHEFPPGSLEPIHKPAIREGYHRLSLSLWDESGNFLWLENFQADPAGNFGQRHEIGRLYVTPNPIEVSDLQLIPKGNPWDLACMATLVNHGNEDQKTRIRFSLVTPSGFQAANAVTEVSLLAGRETKTSFEVGPSQFAGELNAQLQLHLPEGFVSYAETDVFLPEPFEVDRQRANRVVETAGGFRVPITLDIPEGSKRPFGSVAVKAFADGILQQSTDWILSQESAMNLDLEPSLGWYTIHLHQQGAPAIERRVIAPVLETHEGKLFLNGEPFYVKGVNCHGMIPQSPERTRLMMRILKGMGFNMMRGDYPPAWELDVAQEENMGWMVLAPFSVTTTDILKERHDPHPMARMREITRRFIPHYVDKPSMWLWNNFNEVTGETDDFLAMFYPHYKEMDPYRRPVVYANLTGQDRFIGQDVMGINYYYRPYTPIEELKKMIHASQAFGAEANLPVIYTEYNNWYGPVYTEGARAVNEMFAAELSPEHPGGFFYMLRENIDRHPGVVIDDDTVWTNPTLERAFKYAFEDLEISEYLVDGQIELKNKRPFTLRKMSYQVYEGPVLKDEGTVEDLAPGESAKVSMGPWSDDGTKKLTVKTRFETHYGIGCEVEGAVFP